MQSPSIRRYSPDDPFPAYSYVPGRFPHPTRDAAGHSFGHEVSVASFSADDWKHCGPYLFGLDLFNHGFYWEAHEQWEAVWLAAGRTGVIADLLKGLIKLAAAGVKVREGQPNGVRRHAMRAEQLFTIIQEAHKSLLGLTLEKLIESAEQIAAAADELIATSNDSPAPLFDHRIEVRPDEISE
jgi:uncharacterized protein